MSTTMPLRMSPRELDSYLLSQGLLHDCSASLIDRGNSRLDVEILDVNAAFKGLSGYKGRVACVIALEDAGERDAIAGSGTLKVFEAAMELDAEGNVTETLLITFWPTGHLKVTISHAFVHESAMGTALLC